MTLADCSQVESRYYRTETPRTLEGLAVYGISLYMYIIHISQCQILSFFSRDNWFSHVTAWGFLDTVPRGDAFQFSSHHSLHRLKIFNNFFKIKAVYTTVYSNYYSLFKFSPWTIIHRMGLLNKAQNWSWMLILIFCTVIPHFYFLFSMSYH